MQVACLFSPQRGLVGTGTSIARVRDRVGRPAEFDIRLTRAKKRG